MEKTKIRQQILSALDQLNKRQQESLLAFIKSLIEKKPNNKPDILKMSGKIEKDDLKLMKKAIQEDCEKINPDEW